MSSPNKHLTLEGTCDTLRTIIDERMKMAVFLDRKYLLMVSPKLDNFKQKKEDLYNFRCPFCGDSSKKKTKTRGFIYKKNNDYFYKCFNDESCSTTFYKFLENIDSRLAKEYALERYRNGDDGHHNYTKPKFQSFRPVFKKKQIILPTIKSLSEDHPAKIFIQNRKIPVSFYNDLFYAENFKDFVLTLNPEYENNISNDPRIIIPFKDENDSLIHLQGRTINNNALRYFTINLSEHPKIFGLEKLDKRKLVYVLEAPLDSLFIKNAIATADSNLEFGIKYFKERNEKVNTVLIPDIQPRNNSIVNNIERWVESGYTVCLLPNSLKGKDINELIQNGLTKPKLEKLLIEHTFSGLRAKIEFLKWKQI